MQVNNPRKTAVILATNGLDSAVLGVDVAEDKVVVLDKFDAVLGAGWIDITEDHVFVAVNVGVRTVRHFCVLKKSYKIK
jgi:hypothetical protein